MTRRDAVVGGLLVPVCAGLAGAALNVAWYLARRYLLNEMVFNGLDELWLTSCASVVLALIPGIPLLILLTAWPRPWAWRLLVAHPGGDAGRGAQRGRPGGAGRPRSNGQRADA
jgi:hypothetical protein